MEQMDARSSESVRDSMAVRDSTTAGCREAAGSSIGERDSENVDQLRKHVAQMMGGNEALRREKNRHFRQNIW